MARKKPAGTIDTVKITERVSPPISALASGAYDSLPSHDLRAIGKSPMIVAREVITPGAGERGRR